MIVADFMTPDPVTVGPNDSLETALQAMDEYSVRHLPVVDDGGYLVGVLSHRDLVSLTGWGLLGPEEGSDDRVQWVSQAMATDVVSVTPDDQVIAAAVEVSARGIGCLPVVEDGKLLGIVSEMDLVRLVSENADEGQRVESIGVADAITVTPDATLALLDDLMSAKGVRHLPVVVDGKPTAIISDRDVRRAIGAGVSRDSMARTFMTDGVVSVDAATSIREAAGTMFDRRIGALVLTHGEGRFGIVTTTDLLEHALSVLGS
jgi:CBS domain-containing protein